MEKKVQVPAIGLIVLGILGAVFSALGFLQISFDAQKLVQAGCPPAVADFLASDAGRMLMVTLHVLGLLFNGFTAWAGFQMLRLESWRACVVASVLVMVPATSCCCLIGIPVGIWGLVVLFDREVKQAFQGGGPPAEFTT